jgi:hypothetical protein
MESNYNDNYYEVMDNLFSKPYNYITSFADYLYVSESNTLSNIINDTIKVSINDINSMSMSISDITMNGINNIIYEYKIFITIIILISIFFIYLVNKLIDNYVMKLTEENKKRYKNMININTLKITNSIDNNIQEYQKINSNTNQIRTKGLFIDSVLEINANNSKIIQKIKVNEKDNYYYALLRIKLKHNIILKNSKVNGHNINFEINKDNDTINSGDMYMIIRFNYIYKNEGRNLHMSHVIVNVMNYLNYLTKDEFKNDDFVVLAISKDTQSELNSNQFYNGLKNINYELCNVKHLTLDKEKKIGFILLLPLKQIYDLFLDVYNDIIFESTSYKIDYDNNECWYNNSLNDIL